MNKLNKHTKRSGMSDLSLNDDRGDATWQYDRGPRYGNARKARAKMKQLDRRKNRRDYNINNDLDE